MPYPSKGRAGVQRNPEKRAGESNNPGGIKARKRGRREKKGKREKGGEERRKREERGERERHAKPMGSRSRTRTQGLASTPQSSQSWVHSWSHLWSNSWLQPLKFVLTEK